MKRSISKGMGTVWAVLLVLAGPVGAADNWPQFRGPTMNASVADNPALPDRWSLTENVEWVTEIPPLGWSSPVVWGNRVFVTTATSSGDFEQPKPGLYAPRGRSEPPKAEHDWRVYCLDLESGAVLWHRSVKSGLPEFPRHQKNTYASETATTDGEMVYVRFGELGLFAFDMDGNEVWRKMIPHKQTMSDWGSASSPVLHGDHLIVVYDNEEESWIAALDKKTGDEVWRVARDEPTSWATPYVWANDDRTEIVVPGRTRIRSYDLEGNELWQMNGRMSWATIATPFSSHGLVFVTSGYFQDSHKPVYAIRAGASGDITLAEGETSNEHVAWYLGRAGNYNTSPLVYGDQYYSLLDRGFFESYDVRTGEPVYGRNRINARGIASFTSSPWAYNGKIFALSEQGDTYVIKAGPDFEVLHVNSLDEMAMASPAIVGDRLLIRTRSKLYSIKKGASMSASGGAGR
jgi:outer membrane protein assembly factor BamB